MYYGRLLPLCFTERRLANNSGAKQKSIREGRFELPTKGSPRRIIHTLQSSALPLSYPRLLFDAHIWPPSNHACDRPSNKKKGYCASTRDRTEDLSVNSRPLCQRSSGGLYIALSRCTSPRTKSVQQILFNQIWPEKQKNSPSGI